MSQVSLLFNKQLTSLHKIQLRQTTTTCYRARQQFKKLRAEGNDAEIKSQVTKEVKEEELPWIRREKEQQQMSNQGDVPFGVYLIGSVLVAIAAVGSVFVFADKQNIFGVLPPSSPLYLPILGFFALTGLPTAGFLFFKAIQGANAMAERMDEIDGV